MMKKIFILRHIFILCLTTILISLVVACENNSVIEPMLVYNQNQLGLIMPSNAIKVTMNDDEVDLYQTISKPLTLTFQSFNLDEGYSNTLEINGIILPLKPANDTQNQFIENNVTLIGPHVVNGTLTLKIKTGTNQYGTHDTFALRNVRIKLDGSEYWSEEFSEANFFNTQLKFGYDLKTENRFGYLEERTFTFKLPVDKLDARGIILTDDQETYSINHDGKTYNLSNPTYVSFDVNLTHQEVITETKQLHIEKHDGTTVQVFLDGMEVRNDFIFSSDAWSIGVNHVTVVGKNTYGFSKSQSYTITLGDMEDGENNLSFKAYEPGVDATLTESIPNSFGKEINPTDYETKFSKYGMMYLEIAVNDDKTISWTGNTIYGRTLIMQAFNTKTNQFETVSTDQFDDINDEILGFNYSLYGTDYIYNNKVIVRIASINTNDISIDQELIHFTDPQYITRYAAGTGSISNQGKDALSSVYDYMKKQYDDETLLYVITSGDYVQSMTNQESEWMAINQAFFNKMFEANIPFGTSSGNHDVGGTSDNPNSNDGGNTLDDKLIYEYYSQHLGDSKFSDKPWFGGSYQDGRSHYDFVTVNNQTFMFLYLGWGSSTWGIHVSSQDINYAKTILDQHMDKVVVLVTHDYMGNKVSRTTTGNYVYEQLVVQYPNIKMVFSGHVNGTSARIDALDDDHDGIADREVIQVLTDLQEEENLFGATWLRKIGLDYENNKIHFQLYSPYMNDYDIIVSGNPNVVKEHRTFDVDFNLSNVSYVMMTKGIH